MRQRIEKVCRKRGLEYTSTLAVRRRVQRVRTVQLSGPASSGVRDDIFIEHEDQIIGGDAGHHFSEKWHELFLLQIIGLNVDQ